MLFSVTAAGMSPRGTMSPAQQERKRQQQPRRDLAGDGEDCQYHRHRHHRALRHQHQASPVEAVGERSRGQGKDHDGQGGRGLNQSDHIVGLGNDDHHPAGAHALYQGAEIGEQRGGPKTPEIKIIECVSKRGSKGQCPVPVA
jgi:hypothetical protein